VILDAACWLVQGTAAAAAATALSVIAAVTATARMATVAAGECAHRASRRCFRNPSASATQFARHAWANCKH